MLFSSIIFLWTFLPIVGIAYFFCKDRYRNFLLLVASLFFYAWGEPIYVLLMIFSIFINYLIGLSIGSSRSINQQRFFIIAGITFNLILLIIFKYVGFIVNNINLAIGVNLTIPQIALPIGISFYTFQAMSYIIDVYRGKKTNYSKGITPQRNLFNLALYISFFPQLIAGPIVQYNTIQEQLKRRTHSSDDIAFGLKRFIYGLGKKVLISNTLAGTADKIFSLNETQLNTPIAWVGIICYTFQIYYDFSGYSDMAIGLGRIFGFKFLENFNHPYIASTIQDFWRRWHISLSSWFREYLYIPLGGNRHGLIKTYRNLIIVFFITGLWHGASWNFIVWGLWHGIFILIERLFFTKVLNNNKLAFLNHIYTLLVVIIGWVFFRAQTLSDATIFIKKMFSFDFNNAISVFMYLDSEIMVVLFFAILLCGIIQLIAKLKTSLFKASVSITECIALAIILALCTLNLVSGEYNPFIYFQF